MGDQMKLLFTLSNAKMADDNQDFYDKEIKPLLESLLKQGVQDLNFTSLLGDTIPHICTYNSLPNTLNAIYQFSNANKLNLDLTRCDGKVGQTPIAIAAVMGNVALVEWFLSKANTETTKVMLRRTDESQKLPVYFAASFPGDPKVRDQIVNLLDPKKTLRHKQDINGISAEYVMKHPGFVYPGSERCPVLRDCFGRSEFMMNVFRHNIAGLQSALAACKSEEEKQALVNAQDYCGRSALIYACYMGFTDVVELLAESFVLSLQTASGETYQQYPLLPYADVNQADNKGLLPLHFAVLYLNKVQPTDGSDKTQIIQTLLDSGAKNLANDNEKTPVNFAFIMGEALGNLASMIAVVNMIDPISSVKTPSRKLYVPGLMGEMAAMRVSEEKVALAEKAISTATKAETTTTSTSVDGFQLPSTRKYVKRFGKRSPNPH